MNVRRSIRISIQSRHGWPPLSGSPGEAFDRPTANASSVRPRGGANVTQAIRRRCGRRASVCGIDLPLRRADVAVAEVQRRADGRAEEFSTDWALALVDLAVVAVDSRRSITPLPWVGPAPWVQPVCDLTPNGPVEWSSMTVSASIHRRCQAPAGKLMKAAWSERLGLGFIGILAEGHPRLAGDHGQEFVGRVRMGRDRVSGGEFEAHRERALPSRGRHRGPRSRPLPAALAPARN